MAARHCKHGKRLPGVTELKRAADAMPHHEPCVAMHRDWGVPADRCRVFDAMPVEQRIALIAMIEDTRDDAYQSARPFSVCGWMPSMREGGWFITDDGVDRSSADVVRAIHAAPLPSALAQALWSRCPRADSRMWRLTDVLSEDDAARLEGWSGDRPPWLQVGVGACTDDCKDCWPAGRGIPLANGALARLAPWQGGKMLALIQCVCSTCSGNADAFLDGFGDPVACTHCTGTGRRPLIDLARETEMYIAFRCTESDSAGLTSEPAQRMLL